MATNTAGSTARSVYQNRSGVLRRSITFGSPVAETTLGTVPAGSIIDDAYVIVTTAFNFGTNNRLDIGTAADPDGFATDLALGTVGKIVWDEFATSNDLGPFDADTVISFTPDLTGTAGTTGAATIVVKFIPDNDFR